MLRTITETTTGGSAARTTSPSRPSNPVAARTTRWGASSLAWLPEKFCAAVSVSETPSPRGRHPSPRSRLPQPDQLHPS